MIKKIILLAALTISSMSVHSQTFGADNKIWQQRSLYRNIIVLEGNGHRCLTFGRRSARQSCIEINNPFKLVFGYTQKMLDIVNLSENNNRILIIGIGGGSLPMAIRQKYPEAIIDCVELDSAVVDVAERYFQFKPDEKLTVFAEDGRVFIRKQIRKKIKYDAVLLDAFDKDYIPEHMATKEFLNQAMHLLSENGILIANTFNNTKYSDYEESTYQSVFGTIYESKISNGNRIIIAGTNAQKVANQIPESSPVKRSQAQVMTDRFAPINTLLIH